MSRERLGLCWTIVAGYEGSATSDDALTFARNLFDVGGVRLVVGCVYPYRVLGGRFGSGEHAVAVAESGCRAVARGGVERMVVPAPSPADGLGYLAAAAHADLVVVGSARKALRGRLLRGSTADGLLRAGVCSVAIAPAGYRTRQRGIRTVGAIFDGTPPSCAAVRTAAAVARAVGGPVRIYATAGARARADEILAPLLGGASLEAVVPVRAVAADSKGVLDLVVASHYGRFRVPGLGHARHRRRIRTCRCPVLILRGEPIEARARTPAAGREAAVR